MNDNKESAIHGKPWTTSFTFESFKDADDKRNQILKETPEALQAKVKRRANGIFVVKTRSLVAQPLNKKKLHKRKNKKKALV